MTKNSLPKNDLAANGLTKHSLTKHSLAKNGLTKHSLTKNSLAKNSLAKNSLATNSLAKNGLATNDLTKHNLPKNNLQGRLIEIVDELVQQGVTLEQARREFEKQFIVASIKSNDGNLGRSARSLGVHRNTLRNKVCNLGIASEEYNPRFSARRHRRLSGKGRP